MKRTLKTLCLVLSFCSLPATANKLSFAGSVVDNAYGAAATCLSRALKDGVGATCAGKTGTVVLTTVKDALVPYRGDKAMARFITLHFM